MWAGKQVNKRKAVELERVSAVVSAVVTAAEQGAGGPVAPLPAPAAAAKAPLPPPPPPPPPPLIARIQEPPPPPPTLIKPLPVPPSAPPSTLPLIPFCPTPHMPWTERYRPQAMAAVCGNAKAKTALLKWAQGGNFREPVLLVGPTGVGKTALVKALCNDMRWVSLDCQALPGELIPLVEQVLFRKQPANLALILDEVDTWHGNERSELVKLLNNGKRNRLPILCVAEETGRNMESLKRLCTVIKMTRLPMDMRDAFPALVRGLRASTGQNWSPPVLQQVERIACHDLRRAVIMLEMAATGRLAGTSGDLFIDSIFDAAECILSAHPQQLSGEAASQVFGQHDLMLYMLHENALKRHDVLDLCAWFSDMDLIDSHASHTTHAYAGALSGHLFASLEPPFLRMPRLEFPAALGTMSRRRGKAALLDEYRLSYDDWSLLAPVARAELQTKVKVPIFFQHLCAQQKYGTKEFRKAVLEHGALPHLSGNGTA